MYRILFSVFFLLFSNISAAETIKSLNGDDCEKGYVKCLLGRDIRIFASLDSILINQKQEGVHTRSNNSDNPFSNINGISLGISYNIPATNLYLTLKTNRFLNFPVKKQAAVYNDDTFIKNATSSFQSQNDILSVGYRFIEVPYLLPFIFISNSNVTTRLIDSASSKITQADTFSYGIGANLFLSSKISISSALILPNNDIKTDYGLALSVNYLLFN